MDRISKLLSYLEATPQDAFLQHALALEYIKLGKDREARSLFEEILNREPNYVGSYYHLAKLLERVGEQEKAREVYAKGMAEAKKQNDRHAYNELQMALEEIEEEG